MTVSQTEQDEIYPMPSFPMLQVSDLAASGRWYQDALGFRHIFTMPGPGGEASLIHLRWRKYADLLLVSDREPPETPRGVGVSLHFSLQEGTVDDLVEQARAAGATVVRAPTDQPWNVRDATIADPDGYRLIFSHGPLQPIGTIDKLIREMHEGN